MIGMDRHVWNEKRPPPQLFLHSCWEEATKIRVHRDGQLEKLCSGLSHQMGLRAGPTTLLTAPPQGSRDRTQWAGSEDVRGKDRGGQPSLTPNQTQHLQELNGPAFQRQQNQELHGAASSRSAQPQWVPRWFRQVHRVRQCEVPRQRQGESGRCQPAMLDRLR